MPLFADELTSAGQITVLGILAAVLLGLGRLVWWVLPKALEAHTGSIKEISESNEAAIEKQSIAHRDAVAALIVDCQKERQEYHEERLRIEARFDRELEKRDKIISDLTAAFMKLTKSKSDST